MHAMPSRVARSATSAGLEVKIASNLQVQTHITYYHGDCYRQRYAAELHHVLTFGTISAPAVCLGATEGGTRGASPASVTGMTRSTSGFRLA